VPICHPSHQDSTRAVLRADLLLHRLRVGAKVSMQATTL
jgi:hypothetical protein